MPVFKVKFLLERKIKVEEDIDCDEKVEELISELEDMGYYVVPQEVDETDDTVLEED